MKLQNFVQLAVLLAAIMGVAGACYAAFLAEEGSVDCVVGFTPVGNDTYVAFYVPFSNDYALSGIRWFNNDGSVGFPRILVCPGFSDGPGEVADAVAVASNVGGGTLAWSDVEFEQPIASSQEGLHVILQLPSGSVFEDEGLGGGAGFGYQHGETGVSGWITADGQDWIGLETGSRFAVQVSLVPVVPGMILMSPVSGRPGSTPGAPPGLDAAGVIAAPNPFNPQVQVWYNLVEPKYVRIDVFDVRGRHLRKLLDGNRPAGSDYVVWAGDDNSGRRLASGSYVIVVRRGVEQVTRTVTLLK